MDVVHTYRCHDICFCNQSQQTYSAPQPNWQRRIKHLFPRTRKVMSQQHPLSLWLRERSGRPRRSDQCLWQGRRQRYMRQISHLENRRTSLVFIDRWFAGYWILLVFSNFPGKSNPGPASLLHHLKIAAEALSNFELFSRFISIKRHALTKASSLRLRSASVMYPAPVNRRKVNF